MNLIEKYLTRIEGSKKSTNLYIGNDVLFLTVNHKTSSWDKLDKMRKNKRSELAVLILTNVTVFKLEPIHHNFRPYVDRILGKIKYGTIDSKRTLLASLGEFRTPQGVLCVRLVQTKLDYYL